MEVLTFDHRADWFLPLGKRLHFVLRSAGRCERGQAALEYGGVLLVVTLVIAAIAGGFGATGLSGTLRSVIQRELCVMGVESFGGTCPRAVISPATRANTDANAIRRALSNGRLVDACAGGPRRTRWPIRRRLRALRASARWRRSVPISCRCSRCWRRRSSPASLGMAGTLRCSLTTI